MADADPLSKTMVPFKVTNPTEIPSQRYYDEEFYRLENEKLWPHAWQMACRTEMIPNVGDWAEYSNLGRSVIVVRAKDGIKAYHNACRHRGVQLAKGHGNCKTQGFICPFHGWRWNMEGKNTFVYGKHFFEEGQIDKAALELPQAQVEEFVGCVWINWDKDAPSFRETMGAIVPGMDAYNSDKMHAEWWYATVLPANWKISMEAFMEGYHVMRTHPQLQQNTPALYNAMYGQDTGGIGVATDPHLSIADNIKAQIRSMELLSEGMSGMCHAKDVEVAKAMGDIPLPDDPDLAVRTWYGAVAHAVTQAGRARGEPTPDLIDIAMTKPLKAVEFLFPHYFLLPYMSSMSAYRIRPLGPESCLFEIWSLTHFPEGQEPEPIMEPTFLAYDSKDFPPIPQQDYANIPEQQLGLHAEGFEYMRLSGKIEGMISNYNRIIDGYLAGAPGEKLSGAIQQLASNFDGPVKDLGL